FGLKLRSEVVVKNWINGELIASLGHDFDNLSESPIVVVAAPPSAVALVDECGIVELVHGDEVARVHAGSVAQSERRRALGMAVGDAGLEGIGIPVADFDQRLGGGISKQSRLTRPGASQHDSPIDFECTIQPIGTGGQKYDLAFGATIDGPLDGRR